MDGRTDGRMEGWTDRRTDGWTEGRTKPFIELLFATKKRGKGGKKENIEIIRETKKGLKKKVCRNKI